MEENKIIKKNDSFEILDQGEKVLSSHDFYRDLSEIMEDEKFSNFFDKYFTSMNEIKISVVYMKLYQEFKKTWKKMTDNELDKRINTFLLWKLMKDREINRFTLHTVMKHLENPNKVNIIDEMKEFIDITDKTMKLK
jgi:hypothetical protein